MRSDLMLTGAHRELVLGERHYAAVPADRQLRVAQVGLGQAGFVAESGRQAWLRLPWHELLWQVMRVSARV
jgi:hypothetical protein